MSSTDAQPFIVTRDYIQHHFICALAEIGDEKIVFKGGTLMRVCVILGYRYSEDLDFIYYGTVGDLLVTLRAAAAIVRQRTGYELELLPDRRRYHLGELRWGPTEAQTIRVDADLSDHGRLSTQMWHVLPNYPDLPSSPAIRGYTLVSLAVTKLACLSARSKARDFHDFDHVLRLNVDPERVWAEYVEEVERRRSNGVSQPDPTRTRGNYLGRIQLLTSQWQDNITEGLIPSAPPFSEVLARVDAFVQQQHENWQRQLPHAEHQWRLHRPKNPASERDRRDLGR